MPTADFVRQILGFHMTPETPEKHRRGAHVPKKVTGKPMIIKVQVPWDAQLTPEQRKKLTGPMMVYNKKRDFVCTLHREDDADAYDRLSAIIHDKGVGGAKAYFAAELAGQKSLVVKVSEVVAEQGF
jgi:hypothetical protein